MIEHVFQKNGEGIQCHLNVRVSRQLCCVDHDDRPVTVISAMKIYSSTFLR